MNVLPVKGSTGVNTDTFLCVGGVLDGQCRSEWPDGYQCFTIESAGDTVTLWIPEGTSGISTMLRLVDRYLPDGC